MTPRHEQEKGNAKAASEKKMNQTQTARSYSKVFPHSSWLKLPSPNHDPRDRRFQLRKTFELEAVPTKADICVTADAKYSLYING